MSAVEENAAKLAAERAEQKRLALAGRPGLDHLPDERCVFCGAVPWWSGKRYETDHDHTKHGVFLNAGEGADARRTARHGDSSPQAVRDVLSRVQPVRRATGERDED